MKSMMVGLALCASALAYTEVEYQGMFRTWMAVHNKAYTSDEFTERYSIFKSNADYVRDFNNEEHSFTVGLNLFADITNEEYQRTYLGTKIDGTAKLAAAADIPKVVFDTYNNTVDWRTKGVVTPAKNQGQCGSCWSFSTTGSVEGAHAQATGNLVSLSEQNLVDCSKASPNAGCDGGLMDVAFAYIISNKGIDTEASYPYTAKDGTCQFNAANVGATISNYTDVTSGDEGALTAAAAKQPVSVAIDASHISFQLYKGGVYSSVFCSTTKLDHGVLVVGYGTDSTKGKDYYIVKNSWGTSYGVDQGYIYMARNDKNMCGIATSASVPIV